MSSQCRVVVTGLGLLSPLGVSVPHVWPSLLSGSTGIVRIPADFFSRYGVSSLVEKLPSKVAAIIPRGDRNHEFNIDQFSTSQRRQMSMSALFALQACNEALVDAGFENPKSTLPDSERENFGVAVGVGMIDLEDVHETGRGFYSKGYSSVGPYFIPRILPNMAAGHIAIANGLQGPNHCVSTACATGAHAIGDAFTMIKRRQATVMICGGSEASLAPLAIAGFCRLRALSTRFNDNPSEASRPFDADRDGFVIGEGAAVAVLEEYEHAIKRRAPKIYAEVLGYGLSGDGFHITSPDRDGKGAFRCMKKALADAGQTPSDIGYINAHATSTPQGDEVEASAIARLFENVDFGDFAVSSTKGATGHLLGAAGAAEFIFTVLACYHGVLPPTLNLKKTDIDIPLNLVPLKSQPWPSRKGECIGKRRLALTNSFGFGGTNILCLHGYRQNADVFRQKTDFISAPHVANVDNTAAATENNVKDEKGSSDAEHEPRGWWFSRPNCQFSSRDVTDLCEGFDETKSLLDRTFREQGPFHGILGFSQGACLAALICSLQENGEFNHNFNFVILFAGFQSGSAPHRYLVETRLSKPSIHVVGESDAIISEEMSKSLIDQFADAVVIEHPGGHMVPSSKAVACAISEGLQKFTCHTTEIS